jgi:hypothetical protein
VRSTGKYHCTASHSGCGIQEHIGTIVRDGTIAAKRGEFISGLYGVDSNDTTLVWGVGVYPAWLHDAQDTMELPPQLRKDITRWVHTGSERLWKRLFPVVLTAIMQGLGMTGRGEI